jgi:peptidoglycan/LPS O-acetylase OafA/YrhL
MRRDLSAFLDLTRMLAALTVFLSHLSNQGYGGEVLADVGAQAHTAVVAFFVLSGFVVAREESRSR